MIGTKTDLSTTRALMDLCGAVGTLPLYRMYRKDLRFFGKMQVSMCGEEGGHRSKTERTAQPRLNRNKGPEMCSESLLCRTDCPWFTFGICDEHPQRIPFFVRAIRQTAFQIGISASAKGRRVIREKIFTERRGDGTKEKIPTRRCQNLG